MLIIKTPPTLKQINIYVYGFFLPKYIQNKHNYTGRAGRIITDYEFALR